MPWIDDPEEFNRAFVPPGNVQCVECHQADPFITNTFINAAKIPGTNESVIPILDADSPYYVIGGANWDMRTVHIKDNACFDCHRIGQSTLKLFTNSGWDPNDHMPPDDPGSLADDLREVLDVMNKGPDKVKGAEWVIPPKGDGQNRVVGDDYPNKAYFNRLVSSKAGGMKGKPLSKVEASEIEALLNRLDDAGIRKAFETWFEEYGADPATLEKLRGMVNREGKK